MIKDQKQCVYEHWRADLNVCFYVGRGPSKRANSLNSKLRNKHHSYVVAKMNVLGFGVEVKIYAGGLSVEEANILERARIAHYRALKHPLTNQTDGGEGLVNPALEVCEKMAARQRGKKLPVWHRVKIALANTGRKHTAEHRANLNAVRINEKRPPLSNEHRAMISAALKGRTKAPEVRARMSKGSLRREARHRIEREARRDLARIDQCALLPLS